VQGLARDVDRDAAVRADRREVTHAAQQPVRDARRAAASALRARPAAGILDLDREEWWPSGHDPREVLGRVVVEPQRHAEGARAAAPTAARARRRADEREALEIDLERSARSVRGRAGCRA
jgi:hypothetical protein